jgi:hypothetical protein
MKNYAVAFSIHKNGHKPVFADSRFGHDDFAACSCYKRQWCGQVVATIEVNEGAFSLRLVAVAMGDAAALFPEACEALVPEDILRYIDYQGWVRSKFQTLAV